MGRALGWLLLGIAVLGLLVLLIAGEIVAATSARLWSTLGVAVVAGIAGAVLIATGSHETEDDTDRDDATGPSAR